MSTELLLKELACTLHHATSCLGDDLIFGRARKGEGSAYRAPYVSPYLLQGRDLLCPRDIDPLLPIKIIGRELDGDNPPTDLKTLDEEMQAIPPELSLSYQQALSWDT